MTVEENYNVWGAPGGTWSPWVKPVLFAHMSPLPPNAEQLAPALESAWVERDRGDTAYVMDLPGVAAVTMGLELARLGWRPVPLFNAAPGPSATPLPVAVV